MTQYFGAVFAAVFGITVAVLLPMGLPDWSPWVAAAVGLVIGHWIDPLTKWGWSKTRSSETHD